MRSHVWLLLTVGVVLAADEPKTAAEKEAIAHNWSAVGHIIKGDYDKAIAECTEAIRLDPKNDLPHLNRGGAYSLKGEHDKAIADFDQAIRLNPKNGAPYSNRAAAYAAKGRYSEAIKGFQQAINVEPKRGDTYGHLADLLATCPKSDLRDGKKAVELATKACELTKWNDSISLSALAAAYAETADFKKAVEWQKKAIEANGSLVIKRTQDVEEGRQRLKRYEESKPYRRQAVDGGKPETANADKDALQGTWVAVAGENSKVKFDKELKGIRLTVRGGEFTLQFGDDTLHTTYKLALTRKAKAIDLTFTGGRAKGETMLGIYALEGGDLKLCFSETDQERPTEFAAEGKPGLRTLLVFRHEAGDRRNDKETNSTLKGTEDQKRLQGTWRVVAIEEKGLKTPVDRNYTLTFTGDRLHQLDMAQNGADFRYSFKLDPSKTPAKIDMTVTEAGNAKDKEEVGKTLLGIYALDGDNLRLCADPNVRPTTLDTKGKGRDTVLMILKREKK